MAEYVCYYEHEAELRPRGIDYDLVGCLNNNDLPFEIADIDAVLAVWEGQNDGDDWRWVLRLKDGRFAFVQGGCDYTGWDCQSWAASVFCPSAEEAALKARSGEVPLTDSQPADAGLGHALSILTGEYLNDTETVYASLLKQLADGKHLSWREKKDDEFGL